MAFPDTPSGRIAHAYFDAYAAGEAAVRSFFAANVSAEDLAERPADVRVERWRGMHERLGALTPLVVLSSSDARVEVKAKSEKAGTVLVTFECRDEAPHTLQAVMLEQTDDTGGAPAAPPADAGPPPSDEAIVARLSATLDSLARADRFSGVAVLDKGGRTLFAKAYGMASREAKRPVTLGTRFNIASIGKQFTATSIRQLAAAGKLSLSDPVTRWLPDYRVPNAEHVTLDMLMEHRAGVPDVFGSQALWQHPERVRTAGDWYALVRERPLEFEPGTRQRYSNGGYVLLGMVVERVSGEDYYDYVRRHVFEPAGMTRTDSYLAEKLPADAAVGYTRDTEGRAPKSREAGAGPWPIAAGFGRASAAGGTHSTAGDLVRFAQALRSDQLVPKDPAQGPGVGLGVAGGAPGTNALLEIHGGYTLVILANQDPPVAEDFAKTVGRMLVRASGEHREGRNERVRAGGN